MQKAQLSDDEEQSEYARSVATEEVLSLLWLPHRPPRDPLITDRLAEPYGSPEHLAARASIYQYRVPPLDFFGFARDLVNWRGDERVLDAGSGPGWYLENFREIHPRIRPVACDLSFGMASVVDAPACVGDVGSLPFQSRSFDVTLAMHMLYHVEDISKAIAELKRVTSVGGTVLVATNSTTHVRELKALFAEALAAVLHKPVPMPDWVVDRFNLENGNALLEGAFSDVRRKAAWGTLYVPGAEPIVSYIRSLRPFYDLLPGDQAWEQVFSYVRDRAEEVIKAKGSFEIAARAGVFVCRP